MSYKIAIASSNGKNIDISFGAATFFNIYEVDDRNYRFLEKRNIDIKEEKEDNISRVNSENDCTSEGCNKSSGCGSHTGCANGGLLASKVDLIGDCRSIICKKIGFNVTKQLEKKAIAGFDVECSIDEALSKIVSYFYKMDNHESLRNIRKINIT